MPEKTQARPAVPGGPETHPILKISHRKLTGSLTVAQIIGPGSPLSLGQPVDYLSRHSGKCRKLFWKARQLCAGLKSKQVTGTMKVDKPL